MKLSVIVPVYNVEKFLPRCLDSLLRQGMEMGEWEVICVNDGSPPITQPLFWQSMNRSTQIYSRLSRRKTKDWARHVTLV